MAKKTVAEIDVHGRRVLVRNDFNVPLDEHGAITDDRRIRAALPTLRHLLEGGASLVLVSHLGRPQGDADADRKLSLAPVARRLGELLDRSVTLAPAAVGAAARDVVNTLRPGQVCLLENLRFHAAETIKDRQARQDAALKARKEEFARQIASYADAYVNDAFGTCHRDNASMLTVPRMMVGKPRVVGFLVEKELAFLGDAVRRPRRPFVVVLGGAKVSDKLGVIESLLEQCDTVLIGGAMCYTFLAASGTAVGRSLIEPDRFDVANALRARAKDRLLLPSDSVAADRIAPEATTKVCAGAIDDDLMGLDIGPQTIETFRRELSAAATIVWNGPMGVFEVPPFDTGTVAVADAVAQATDRGAVSVIGGGDSAAAVERAGVGQRVTHVSTGGGASLEFLQGRPFAALEVLDDG